MSKQATSSSNDGILRVLAKRFFNRYLARDSQSNSKSDFNYDEPFQLEAIFDMNGCVCDVRDVS